MSSVERTCGICTNDYGGTVVPTILTCCLNHVCFGCAESYRAEKISGLTGNKKKIKCMMCNQLFHSSKDTPWKVNKPFIDLSGIDVDMRSVKEAQAAMRVAPAAASKNGSRNSQRAVMQESEGKEEEVEEDNNRTVVSETVSNDPIGELRSSSTSTSMTKNVIRRSQRINQMEEAKEYDSDSDSSRFSTECIEERGEVSNIQDAPNASRSNDTRARKRTRDINSDHTISGSTLPSSPEEVTQRRAFGSNTALEASPVVINEQDQLWRKIMTNNNRNVYRIRCYNTESKTSEDKFARKCSQWCVNNGYIVTCAEVAKILPKDKQHNGQALQEKFRSVDFNTLREECHQCKSFSYDNEGSYIRTYKQFIEMKKGDIVVLHTKGGTSKTQPPQTLTFGVIQDESLTLMYKDEAIQKHGFPWDFRNPAGVQIVDRTGLMVKKVKWYRQGELRTVRGNGQVNWLAEYEVVWFSQVGRKNKKYLEQAIRKMSSDKFLQNTHAIDNSWTMG